MPGTGALCMIQRIHIIGSTSSGKTHIARLLSERLGIPSFDLDDLASQLKQLRKMGGMGGVSLSAQLMGTALGVTWAFVAGLLVYGLLKATVGLRLTQEEEFEGADLTLHKISATPDREVTW